MPRPAIEGNRSVVLAADVEPEDFRPLVEKMGDIPGVNAVKIGFEVGLGLSLCEAVAIVHDKGLTAVYDHQKGGNDIPAIGTNFARTMERANVDAAILFPFTGPVTQRHWTEELQQIGVQVITGAEMTHDQMQASADGRTGGYINGEAFRRIFELAVELDVEDFVVPGNKPARVRAYRELLDEEIGIRGYTLWAPGFITQGGDLTETGRIAGPNFNAIVGSGIYGNENPRQAAIAIGQQLLASEYSG